MTDGIPEFAKHKENSFVVPKVDYLNMSLYEQDNYDLNKLYEILEMKFFRCIRQSRSVEKHPSTMRWHDVKDHFNSDRMADECIIEFFIMGEIVILFSIKMPGKIFRAFYEFIYFCFLCRYFKTLFSRFRNPDGYRLFSVCQFLSGRRFQFSFLEFVHTFLLVLSFFWICSLAHDQIVLRFWQGYP